MGRPAKAAGAGRRLHIVPASLQEGRIDSEPESRVVCGGMVLVESEVGRMDLVGQRHQRSNLLLQAPNAAAPRALRSVRALPLPRLGVAELPASERLGEPAAEEPDWCGAPAASAPEGQDHAPACALAKAWERESACARRRELAVMSDAHRSREAQPGRCARRRPHLRLEAAQPALAAAPQRRCHSAWHARRTSPLPSLSSSAVLLSRAGG